jgi:hypothetical protein
MIAAPDGRRHNGSRCATINAQLVYGLAHIDLIGHRMSDLETFLLS